ncbi:MAG: glycosyltransferase [Patescibacteria group bacterium]|nr:glycosyltransferase [Patescibacteria group bacterium]
MIIGIANNLLGEYGRGSGAEVIAENMAADFRRQGHQVFIVTTKPKGAKNSDSDDIYYLESNYHRLKDWPASKKFLWHAGQLVLPGNCRQIKKILQDRKPNLFITHNLVGLGACLPRLLKKYGIRHEHVLHDIQLLHPSGLMYWGQEKIISSPAAKIYQAFTKYLLKNASLIISPSRWLLALHRQHGFFANQAKEIRPNFNLKKITPPALKKPVKFVFTGQIEKHKGIKILLLAWQQAALSPETAKLIIAGDGSLAKWLEKETASIDNIDYVGRLDRSGIAALLDESDVLVLPSLVYENSPTSIWEAAAAGRRAIASDIGGIPELAPYLDLSLIPPDDVSALAKAMKTIID